MKCFIIKVTCNGYFSGFTLLESYAAYGIVDHTL